MVNGLAPRNSTAPEPVSPLSPPGATQAEAIIARNGGPGRLDMAGLARDIDWLRLQDPAAAAAVIPSIDRLLTPVERGQLAARLGETAVPEFTPAATPTPLRVTITPEAMLAPTPPATATPGAPVALAQAHTDPAQTNPQVGPAQSGPDPAALALDLTQMALDIVGIFEPTPFADGANTGLSVLRALGSLFTGRFGEAGDHAINGLLSAVSLIPYLGDAAKLGKIGRWAGTVADAVRMVADNPALRSALEPALKAVHEALKQIPATALDSLPASARESLEAMRRQLDGFFAAAGRAIVDVTNFGKTVRINGREVAIGAPPVTATRVADGRPVAIDAAGNEQLLRRPTTNVSRADNPDGTVTYTNTRNGGTVRYDANGFPLFETVRADLYLPPDKIVVNSRSAHFTEANRILAQQSDAQLRAVGFTDSMIADVRAGRTPDGYTWHHHQDVGRMQLVRTDEHELFIGGHTGGWSLWGDGARFRAE